MLFAHNSLTKYWFINVFVRFTFLLFPSIEGRTWDFNSEIKKYEPHLRSLELVIIEKLERNMIILKE